MLWSRCPDLARKLALGTAGGGPQCIGFAYNSTLSLRRRLLAASGIAGQLARVFVQARAAVGGGNHAARAAATLRGRSAGDHVADGAAATGVDGLGAAEAIPRDLIVAFPFEARSLYGRLG